MKQIELIDKLNKIHEDGFKDLTETKPMELFDVLLKASHFYLDGIIQPHQKSLIVTLAAQKLCEHYSNGGK